MAASEHRELDPRDTKELPIVLRCLDLVTWLMETTARMPKHWRPTLVQRIDHEAQEVLLLLTEASYRRRKADVLRRANLALSRLRMLLELALRLKALAPGTHGHALVALDEVGRMLGGWLRSVTRREGRRGDADE